MQRPGLPQNTQFYAFVAKRYLAENGSDITHLTYCELCLFSPLSELIRAYKVLIGQFLATYPGALHRLVFLDHSANAYSQTYSRRRYYRWMSDALSKSFYFQTVKKAKVTTEMQLYSDMHARGMFINLFSFLIEVVFTTFKNLKRLGDLSNTKKTRTASINPVMTCNS